MTRNQNKNTPPAPTEQSDEGEVSKVQAEVKLAVKEMLDKATEQSKQMLGDAKAEAEKVVKEAGAKAVELKQVERPRSSQAKERYRNIGLETKKKLEAEDTVPLVIPWNENLKEKEIAFSINNCRIVVPTAREVQVPKSIYAMYMNKVKAEGAVKESNLNLNNKAELEMKALS